MEYNIDKLDNFEKVFIVNLLKDENVSFTKNNNGYFFNMTNTSADINNKIMDSLDYIIKNKNYTKSLDTDREKYMNQYKNTIEDTLRITAEKNKLNYIEMITLKNDCNIILEKYTDKLYTDPDILISKYNKSRNTLKMHPLFSKIKNFRIKNTQRTNSNSDVIYGDLIDDDNFEDIDNDDFEDNEDNDFSIEEIYQDFSDHKNELSDEEEDNDNDNDNEDDDDLSDCSIQDEEDYSIEDIEDINPSDLKTRMDFYRNILLKVGYTFPQNSGHDILKIQEYIF